MQGQRRGPYDKAQLQEMWNRGKLPKDTLYWHDGMSKWALISDLFADIRMAPPLPRHAGNAESMTFPPASYMRIKSAVPAVGQVHPAASAASTSGNI